MSNPFYTGLKAMFTSALTPLYEDGILIKITWGNDEETGALFPKEQAPQAIKLQLDNCTENMRNAQNYSDDDVRLIVLQNGILGRKPQNGDMIILRDQRWKICSMREDPSESIFDIRATRHDEHDE